MKALDQKDRTILGGALVVVLAFLAAVIVLAVGLGIGVRVFTLVAGW